MNQTGHILVVEDEQDIADLLVHALAKEGYRVTHVVFGDKALASAKKDKTDLVLLDIMLRGMDGREVCRRLMADPQFANVPVIMLTAKGEESDVVSGLELGATDYVVKPFSPKVLAARVRAALRKPPDVAAGAGEVLSVHGISIHTGRREVKVDDAPASLTYTEFQILLLLAKKPGWVFSRYQIVDGVRGEDYPVTERSIDVQIVELRKKLGARGDVIETVRGVGYRMKG
jgi:two-component system phosphate regulon response regulator PhoB